MDGSLLILIPMDYYELLSATHCLEWFLSTCYEPYCPLLLGCFCHSVKFTHRQIDYALSDVSIFCACGFLFIALIWIHTCISVYRPCFLLWYKFHSHIYMLVALFSLLWPYTHSYACTRPFTLKRMHMALACCLGFDFIYIYILLFVLSTCTICSHTCCIPIPLLCQLSLLLTCLFLLHDCCHAPKGLFLSRSNSTSKWFAKLTRFVF